MLVSDLLDDVDLLRALMLRLEPRQLSPREPVAIGVAEEAAALGTEEGDIAEALDRLQSLDYIEGPGAAPAGLWLFRKLTRKGARFVAAARDADDWDEIKRRNTDLRSNG